MNPSHRGFIPSDGRAHPIQNPNANAARSNSTTTQSSNPPTNPRTAIVQPRAVGSQLLPLGTWPNHGAVPNPLIATTTAPAATHGRNPSGTSFPPVSLRNLSNLTRDPVVGLLVSTIIEYSTSPIAFRGRIADDEINAGLFFWGPATVPNMVSVVNRGFLFVEWLYLFTLRPDLLNGGPPSVVEAYIQQAAYPFETWSSMGSILRQARGNGFNVQTVNSALVQAPRAPRPLGNIYQGHTEEYWAIDGSKGWADDAPSTVGGGSMVQNGHAGNMPLLTAPYVPPAPPRPPPPPPAAATNFRGNFHFSSGALRMWENLMSRRFRLPWYAKDSPVHDISSHCPPIMVDISLMDFPVSAVELITFFPEHTRWPSVAYRLHEHGWGASAICHMLHYTRDLKSAGCMQRGTMQKRFTFANTWRRSNSSAVVSAFPSRMDRSYSGKDREVAHTDYYVVDLAEGVVKFPEDDNARTLTHVVRHAMANSNNFLRLSEVAEYARNNDVFQEEVPYDVAIEDRLAVEELEKEIERHYERKFHRRLF
ncbi:unnamed protein product [Periconia digitata]|uniref:Uncharacterized protein n=1 Tax=Periconia digitata TaxID=1303443 RepID=A0A9W4XK23_9PLEO|nr:unnamed protein product [Periconia digitata]